MASFDFDQAEGLRRMLAGPKPRVFTLLSAASGEEKSAMMVNLGASLAQAGRDVLLLDACMSSEGVAGRLNATRGATLMQVARQERTLEEAIQPMSQGFGIAALKRGPQRSAENDPALVTRLNDAFDVLATRADIVLVDAELDKDDRFAIPALSESEIVVQVTNSAASIKSAYAIIKRLNDRLGRRPFSVLVTGASEKEAKVVYENMAQAANRYLAVKLNSMGSVPADEHMKRAMHLGRAVVDAFPLAGASVAFRRLAGRFVLSDVAAAG
ncbi:MAG TPA: antiactivator of flagellar biosynthesis FleN protein [Noviherbaspirillum sp.]